MESPFIYCAPVTGKHFLGRKQDATMVANLVSQRENIVLISGPKEGKTSLIRQAFFNMSLSKSAPLVAEVDMRGIRDKAQFLRKLGDAVIRPFAVTPTEYREAISTFLPGTHFVFDQRSFADDGCILSLNWDPDDKDVRSLLSLPYSIARFKEKQMVVILKEVHNIRFIDGWESIFHTMEDIMKEQRSILGEQMFSYIMTGSRINAMNEIFRTRHFFYRLAEVISLSPIDDKEIIEHIVKGFLSGGKVVDRELIKGACSLLRNNLHYINHFFAICDHLSKGYIMEATLSEALTCLIAIHEPRFEAVMEDLTNFQASLLKAIADGHTKFSSAEVIRSYSLNSSANVKRLKDALSKKEIIVFNSEDEPEWEDPLMEYWVKKYFFRQKLDI